VHLAALISFSTNMVAEMYKDRQEEYVVPSKELEQASSLNFLRFCFAWSLHACKRERARAREREREREKMGVSVGGREGEDREREFMYSLLGTTG
jgi:hypothetical protein